MVTLTDTRCKSQAVTCHTDQGDLFLGRLLDPPLKGSTDQIHDRPEHLYQCYCHLSQIHPTRFQIGTVHSGPGQLHSAECHGLTLSGSGGTDSRQTASVLRHLRELRMSTQGCDDAP